MKIKKTLALFILPALLLFGCQSGTDEGKTIASTHPVLEKQLAEDSLEIPAESGKDTALYSRYRITQQEYQSDKRYGVAEVYRGKMAPLDAGSHTDGATFKTALEAGLKEGVNFAGKYTVVSIGCGTTCQAHYVIERQTGKILDKLQSTYGAKYTANSRVFIINPPDAATDYSQCTNCKPEAFIFENNSFVKLADK